MQTNVVCVLRSGPEYRVEHVHRLKADVAANLNMPHRFVCLTDQVDDIEHAGIEAIPLPNQWPGWFAKINLFAPGLLEGPSVYFDLDVRIVGPLDDILLGHRFTMCEDFYSPPRVNSSMMAWDSDLSAIYKALVARPSAVHSYRVRGKWGDQDFIADHTPIKPERWQHLHPGAVLSYKVHVDEKRPHPSSVGTGLIPEGARVVCFHGKPRPWEVGW